MDPKDQVANEQQQEETPVPPSDVPTAPAAPTAENAATTGTEEPAATPGEPVITE